ncbi:MAG TPA: DMT family transporter [Bryobacteraceae bacterium]|nr:DMT family transporter [Bryobacteraceae bacterium]
MNQSEQIKRQRRPLPLSQPMLLSFLTVLLWGAWGLQSKIIVDRISPWANQALFSLGLAPLLLWPLLSKNLHCSRGSARRGALYGFITGLLGGVGNIAMYLALARGGKASIVIPVVGLAPLVTVVLAFFVLKETLNRVQILGLAAAAVSIYLLSI